MRGLRRWAIAAAGTAALCALPTLVGFVPARADRPPLTTLLARIQASGGVPYSGYAESRGALGLPNLPRLGDVDALLSGTTRMRAWYAGQHKLRVDRLTLIGEDDTYRDAGGSSRWSSIDRKVTRVDGEPPLRLPEAADLLPPELGRRLTAPATAAELHPLPAERIAGRDAVGLRIVPAGPTTIGRIDVWADPRTGLPLRVDVSGRSRATPTVTTRFLDVRLAEPPAGVTTLTVPADAPIEVDPAPDIVAAIDRFAPYRLPDTVAGLARRQRVGGIDAGGAGTYGDGYSLLAVLPLRDGFAGGLLERLTGPPAQPVKLRQGRAAAVVTPLLSTVVAEGPYNSLLLSGTVPVSTLVKAADELLAAPLPSREVP